nr:MAG TPA: hypothetical protein [Caudoviricetes sp.]
MDLRKAVQFINRYVEPEEAPRQGRFFRGRNHIAYDRHLKRCFF